MKLTVEGCRARQQRLIEVLHQNELDGAIVSRRPHVYYFTGWLHNLNHAAAALIRANGEVTLVAADADVEVAADKIVAYETEFLATMHNRQYEMVAEKLALSVSNVGSLGVDMGGGVGCILALAGSDARDITPFILRLRKNKHDDEVEAIRGAIGITEAMYDAAKEAVRPGADEIEVFGYIRQEATKRAGEDLEHLGNDYRANDRGGAARRRTMQAGELYILDAGPSLHGYHADNCRTFAVDGQPSEVSTEGVGGDRRPLSGAGDRRETRDKSPRVVSNRRRHIQASRLRRYGAPSGARHRSLASRTPRAQPELRRYLRGGGCLYDGTGVVFGRNEGGNPAGGKLPPH